MPGETDDITARIIKAVINVHSTLGRGFLESIYRNAMLVELKKQGLGVEQEKEIIIYYDDVEVGRHRMDLMVEHSIVVELKTVEELSKIHCAQLRSYLKATGQKVGLLVSFAKESADFRRVESDRTSHV